MAALPALELPAGVSRGFVPNTRNAERLPSGVEGLDALLGGGFPRGKLSEITGAPSTGRTSLLHRLLETASARGEVMGLVDGSDAFDPASAKRAGVALTHLLWVRPGNLAEALRATEILLGTDGFGLVVLDLEPTRGERLDSAWQRLAQLAAKAGAVLLVSSAERLTGGTAALGLMLTQTRPLWPEHRLHAPLLGGIESRVEIVRLQGGMPGAATTLCFGGQES